VVHVHHVFCLSDNSSKGNQIDLQSFKSVSCFICDSGAFRANLDFAFDDISNTKQNSVQHESFVHCSARPRDLAVRLELLLQHQIQHFADSDSRKQDENLEILQLFLVVRDAFDNLLLLLLQLQKYKQRRNIRQVQRLSAA
jgi:hypothetical protein